MTTIVDESSEMPELDFSLDGLEISEEYVAASASFPKASNSPLSKLAGNTPIRSDRDQWRIIIYGKDKKLIEEYPTYWMHDNPFADSPRVMVSASKLTPAERRQLLAENEEQAALGLTVPRMIVPASAHTIEVRKDVKNPKPGDVFVATWQIIPLQWERRTLSLPEVWEPPADLAELFPGYDWEKLKGYEMQPWETEWADPWHQWHMDFGRRTKDSPVEVIYRYVRVIEKLPFPDDSEDSSRFMSLLVRLADPDPWIGHRIHGRNLFPAAVHPISLIGLNPGINKGFRLPAKNTATKPKRRK